MKGKMVFTFSNNQTRCQSTLVMRSPADILRVVHALLSAQTSLLEQVFGKVRRVGHTTVLTGETARKAMMKMWGQHSDG